MEQVVTFVSEWALVLTFLGFSLLVVLFVAYLATGIVRYIRGK